MLKASRLGVPERASAPPTLSASLPAPAAGAPCHRRGDSEHPRLRALAAASLRAACHRGWVQFSGAFYKGTDPTGGGGEAPLLRPNRLRRPRPLPPSRGGSGSPQSGRGHVHAARKSGVRNASVRTRRRGQTLLRARPGRRGELVRLGMYLRERRVTTPHSPDEGWRLRATTEKITKENRGRLLTPRERKKNCPEELGHHDPTGGKTKQQTKNKNGQRPGAARTRAGEAGLLSPTGLQGKKRETRA